MTRLSLSELSENLIRLTRRTAAMTRRTAAITSDGAEAAAAPVVAAAAAAACSPPVKEHVLEVPALISEFQWLCMPVLS